MKTRTSFSLALWIALVTILLLSSTSLAASEAPLQPQTADLEFQVYLPMVVKPYSFHVAPNPLDMPVRLDASRASDGSGALGNGPAQSQLNLDQANSAQAVIPITGGVITATAADGTVFTLIIPEGALMAETRIVMIPILAINGFPLGGSAGAAVQLEPQGLNFYRPVTLVIEPSAPIPVTAELSIAWDGDGKDFHRYPLDLNYPYPQVAFSLMHFSGRGYIRSEVDPIPINDDFPIPVDPEAQYKQIVEEMVRREREAIANGQEGDPNFHKNMIDLMRYYFYDIIRPVMLAAETDCDYAKRGAVSKVMGWAREADKFRTGDELADEREQVDESFIKTLTNCWEKTTEPCINPNDVQQMQAVLWIAREGQMRGLDFNPNSVPKCTCSGYWSIPAWELTFDVSFQRDAEGREDNSTSYLVVSVDHQQSGTLLLDNKNGWPPSIGWDNGGSVRNMPIGSASINDRSTDYLQDGRQFVNTTSGSGVVGGYAYLTIEELTCTYSLEMLIVTHVVDDSFQTEPEERDMYVLALYVFDRNAYTDPGNIVLSGQGFFDAGAGRFVDHIEVSSGHASHRLFNLLGANIGYGHASWTLTALTQE